MNHSPSRRRALLALGALVLPPPSRAQPDPWQPLRPLVGEWSGTSTGRPGEATVTRSYAFVLGGRYLHETSVSVYAPQERNKTGERHEHWGMFSFDGTRKTLVLRHFHIESFVNTYRHAVVEGRPQLVVFESESFENFSNSWKARETYEFINPDEFVETFELAAPWKEYEVYSRATLKRQP